MKDLITGVSFEEITIVNSTNTAIAASSGSLPVFGTPFMIALMEKATCSAISEYLEEDETTVGTNINVAHSKASGIGDVITAKATLVETDGRKLIFEVSAKDDKGNKIGSGTIERFVVSTEKFMRKVASK